MMIYATHSRKGSDPRPVLVKAGKHLIDPSDVVSITQVNRRLFIVKLRSNPDPKYPLWVEEGDIAVLMNCFNVVE